MNHVTYTMNSKCLIDLDNLYSLVPRCGDKMLSDGIFECQSTVALKMLYCMLDNAVTWAQTLRISESYPLPFFLVPLLWCSSTVVVLFSGRASFSIL